MQGTREKRFNLHKVPEDLYVAVHYGAALKGQSLNDFVCETLRVALSEHTIMLPMSKDLYEVVKAYSQALERNPNDQILRDLHDTYDVPLEEEK